MIIRVTCATVVVVADVADASQRRAAGVGVKDDVISAVLPMRVKRFVVRGKVTRARARTIRFNILRAGGYAVIISQEGITRTRRRRNRGHVRVVRRRPAPNRSESDRRTAVCVKAIVVVKIESIVVRRPGRKQS